MSTCIRDDVEKYINHASVTFRPALRDLTDEQKDVALHIIQEAIHYSFETATQDIPESRYQIFCGSKHAELSSELEVLGISRKLANCMLELAINFGSSLVKGKTFTYSSDQSQKAFVR